MQEFFLWWRAVNVVFGLVVLVALAFAVRNERAGFSNAGRMFIAAHFALMAAAVLVSLEAIYVDTRIGPKSAFITLGILLTFVSLRRYWADRKNETSVG